MRFIKGKANFCGLCILLLFIGACGNVRNDKETVKVLEPRIKVCAMDFDRNILLDQAIDNYKKMYPDVKVELDIISFDNLEEEQDRIKAELMAGDGADIYLDVEYLLDDVYKAQRAGSFSDLVPLLDKYTNLNEEDFFDGTFDVLENGKECYVIPIRGTMQMVAVRKSIQEDLGINVNEWNDVTDFVDGVQKFYDKYPEKQPFISSELYVPIIDNYGFKIWKGNENIDIINQLSSEWKANRDLFKNMQNTENPQMDNYDEQEKEELFGNKSIYFGKRVSGVNDLEDYIRMGAEDGADLVPDYDINGKVMLTAETGVAIADSCKNKEQAILLLEEIITNNFARDTLLKEKFENLVKELDEKYCKKEILIENKIYAGLTETTFSKIGQWLENSAIDYQGSLTCYNGIEQSFFPYLTGDESFTECMDRYDQYLQIYYSE